MHVTPPSSSSRYHKSANLHRGGLRPPAYRWMSSLAWRSFVLVVSLSAVVLVLILCLSVFYYGVVFQQFSDQSPIPDATNHEWTREVDLQPLNLLASQLTGLLRPGNHSGSVSKAEFRSALLVQLLNIEGEIQKVLLSTRGLRNASSSGTDRFSKGVSPSSPSGADVCKKRARTQTHRTIEWRPKENRYLLAICVNGRMSNHLFCLLHHMFFAALLNRTLVLPSPIFDYQYDRVIDIKHINDCIGRNVTITFQEFADMRKVKRVDRIICFLPSCHMNDDELRRFSGLGLSMPKLEDDNDARLKRSADEVKSRFSCEDEVLALGDLFHAFVEAPLVKQPGGPLTHKCKTLMQPRSPITLTAERFVRTFLGDNFVALHFRRGDFVDLCEQWGQNCFFSIPQAAQCILRVIKNIDAPIIYISTDASNDEINLLQKLIVLNGKTIPLVTKPRNSSMTTWDVALNHSNLTKDEQVEALLDKTICAFSNVFIGSTSSSFTKDIVRLRDDWGLASSCDKYLCKD